MSILEAIIQGIIQGLTEFLPVSSSGHLSLLQYFTGRGGEEGTFFTIILHLGTLAAVFIAFRKTIWGLITEFFSMLGDVFKGKFSFKNMQPKRRLLFLLIVSLLPMGITLLVKDYMDAISQQNSIVVQGVCFLLTSLLLFLGVRFGKGKKNAATMRYRDALAIGAMQAVAPLPGISRSGATISVGLLMGLEKEFAVAFSFIMGIPPIIGANILEIKDALDHGIRIPMVSIIVGLVVSFVFGLLAIKLVELLVNSNKFKWFAWYTLVLGLLVLGVGIYEEFANHPLQQLVMQWMSK